MRTAGRRGAGPDRTARRGGGSQADRLLKEATRRCAARPPRPWARSEAEPEATVAALVELLHDASARSGGGGAGTGRAEEAAAPAVPSLVPLLQDREESVRAAAAEAIAQVGPLDEAATDTLVEGLASPDNVVRAQTAEALGTIGAAAEEAAPALVEALADDNDRCGPRPSRPWARSAKPRPRRRCPAWCGRCGIRTTGSAPWRPRRWARWASRPTRPSPPWSARWAISTRRCGATPPRPWARWAGRGRRATGLEAAARDEDGGVRSQAILALGDDRRTHAEPRIEVVLAGLRDADPQVRAAAVAAVGRWGEPSEAIAERPGTPCWRTRTTR